MSEKTTKRVSVRKAKQDKTQWQAFPCVCPNDDPVVADKKKVLFVASEARPFVATGGLADVIGSLPQALAKDSHYDIRVVLPLYSDVKPEHRRKLSFLGNIYVPLGWRNQYCGIFSCVEGGLTYYFIDN